MTTNAKIHARTAPFMFPYSSGLVAFHWELDEAPEGEPLPFDAMVTIMFDLEYLGRTFTETGRNEGEGMHEILVEAAAHLRRDGVVRIAGATGVTTYLRAVGRDALPAAIQTVCV